MVFLNCKLSITFKIKQEQQQQTIINVNQKKILTIELIIL
jgi:hypothetical protein